MSNHDPSMTDGDKKYWYNLKTGQVEFGMVSQSVDRAGPFDTAEEAERAPQVIAERAKAWAAEEAQEDQWGSQKGSDGA